MDYSITSDKINPYVRFAGYSDEYTSSGNKPVYAENCRNSKKKSVHQNVTITGQFLFNRNFHS